MFKLVKQPGFRRCSCYGCHASGWIFTSAQACAAQVSPGHSTATRRDPVYGASFRTECWPRRDMCVSLSAHPRLRKPGSSCDEGAGCCGPPWLPSFDERMPCHSLGSVGYLQRVGIYLDSERTWASLPFSGDLDSSLL